MAKRAKQPGAAPPSVLASPVVSGWMQLIGLFLTALGVVVAVYALPYGHPQAPNRESENPGQQAKCNGDCLHLNSLLEALDEIAERPTTFADYVMDAIVKSSKEKSAVNPDRIFQRLSVTRITVLKRHGLYDAFLVFYEIYSKHKDMPQEVTRAVLLPVMVRLAALVDEAIRQLEGATPSRTPILTATPR
jgi:hypothetical protein